VLAFREHNKRLEIALCRCLTRQWRACETGRAQEPTSQPHWDWSRGTPRCFVPLGFSSPTTGRILPQSQWLNLGGQNGRNERNEGNARSRSRPSIAEMTGMKNFPWRYQRNCGQHREDFICSGRCCRARKSIWAGNQTGRARRWPFDRQWEDGRVLGYPTALDGPIWLGPARREKEKLPVDRDCNQRESESKSWRNSHAVNLIRSPYNPRRGLPLATCCLTRLSTMPKLHGRVWRSRFSTMRAKCIGITLPWCATFGGSNFAIPGCYGRHC